MNKLHIKHRIISVAIIIFSVTVTIMAFVCLVSIFGIGIKATIDSNKLQEKPQSAFVLEASEPVDGAWIRIVRIKETNERFLVTTSGVTQMSDAE